MEFKFQVFFLSNCESKLCLWDSSTRGNSIESSVYIDWVRHSGSMINKQICRAQPTSEKFKSTKENNSQNVSKLYSKSREWDWPQLKWNGNWYVLNTSTKVYPWQLWHVRSTERSRHLRSLNMCMSAYQHPQWSFKQKSRENDHPCSNNLCLSLFYPSLLFPFFVHNIEPKPKVSPTYTYVGFKICLVAKLKH